MTHALTPQQLSILGWRPSPATPHLFIRARAGCGKTSTLEEFWRQNSRLLGHSPQFFSFNRAIAEELRNRGLPASTFHAFGLKSLGRTKVSETKSRDLLATMMKSSHEDFQSILDLVSSAKKALVDPREPGLSESLEGLALDLDDPPEDFDYAVRTAAKVLTRSFSTRYVVDFDDMLWLPAIDDTVRLPRLSAVIIDEAQDTSKARLSLVWRALQPGGSVIFAGDDRQAIYAFAGAGVRAIDDIVDRLGPASVTTLPLSISFRCASSIIKEAQRIVPDISPRPDAPEGLVATREWSELPTHPNAILCRNNAPIVTLCLHLLAEGIPCYLNGRETLAGLSAFIKGAGPSAKVTDALLLKNRDRLINLARSPSQVETIEDRFSALSSILASFPSTPTVADLKLQIKKLTTPSPSSICLSTIHKSKGLEWPVVAWLKPSLIPSPYARTPEELLQEENLAYVAITRAKEALYLIPDLPKLA